MDEKKNAKSKETIQNIIMENREKLTISGVLDVISFNEDNVILNTELGTLVVKGQDLHINKLNLDSAELIIEGNIESCEYSDKDFGRSKGFSFLGNLFK